MNGAKVLDVVVGERAAVLELLAREDEALLIRRNALLVLNLLLHVLDRVAGLDIERDGLARQSLDEDLHGAGAMVLSLLLRIYEGLQKAGKLQLSCRVSVNLELHLLLPGRISSSRQ